MESNTESTTKQHKPEKKHVAIIGAGPSGLCMVKHLADDPDTFDPVVFERGPTFGGIWNFKEDDGPMWKEMFTNTPCELTTFGDFENKYGDSFPHNTEVLDYIKDFTRSNNLEKYIKFNMNVTAVELLVGQHAEKWRVTCYDVNKEESMPAQEFHAVIVCNGQYDKTYIPIVEGVERFKGDVIHSRSYRQSKSYNDKKVLLIGAGVSGRELACVIAPVAGKIFLSNKKGPLPSSFPENVHEKTQVKRLTESSVIFMDDTEEDIDAIIFCTGYQFSYPFLSSDVIQVDGNRVKPLYKHILNIEHQSLMFLGLVQVVASFNNFFKHAQFAAAVISGKAKLPPKEEMYNDAEQDNQDRRLNGFRAHFAADIQWKLIRELCEMADIEPYPNVMDKLWDYALNMCFTNVPHFREKKYKITGPDTYEIIN